MGALRSALQAVAEVASYDNPGLGLHRYLTEHDNSAVEKMLDAAAASSAGDAYQVAFGRWRSLHSPDEKRVAFTGELFTPMAIGLGNESPTEVGLSLQHTYGMPVIPGSALKGLCRRAAEGLATAGKDGAKQWEALFGSTSAASHITFWDAWYDPGSVDGRPLKRDVITVHHPHYYNHRGQDSSWPTDFDDPNPVPFLVVRPKARFLYVIGGPGQGWAASAGKLLRWGLENQGVGGKTNAGYGRFGAWHEIQPPPPPPREETWPNCRLQSFNHKGSITVQVIDGLGDLAIQPQQWQSIIKEWSISEREERKEPLSKGRLRANVRVRRDGTDVKLLGLDGFIIEAPP